MSKNTPSLRWGRDELFDGEKLVGFIYNKPYGKGARLSVLDASRPRHDSRGHFKSLGERKIHDWSDRVAARELIESEYLVQASQMHKDQYAP